MNEAIALHRTSQTDPLRIAELRVPDIAGRIGLTLCPGKHASSALGSPWQRDLDTDMQEIAAWAPQVMVTLMEQAELMAFGVAHRIEAACAEYAIEWLHLPIVDGEAPGDTFERQWQVAGLRLRTMLRFGARILVHCRGGLGRAGTVGARLLVELGVPPAEAIAKVRAARPGAIETAAQQRHVERIHAIAEVEDLAHARALGSLLAGAYGDALGYLVEFDSLATIRERHGPAGIKEPRVNGVATVSDDTQMTLFTLEALLRAHGSSKESTLATLEQAYLDWWATQQPQVGQRYAGELGHFRSLQELRAPGLTCLSALRARKQGFTGGPINGSKGCGAVMRVAPFGWFPEWLSGEQALDLAAQSAAITHGHPTAQVAAGATALIVRELVVGTSLEDAVAAALTRVQAEPDGEEVATALGKAIAHAASGTEPDAAIPQLWGDAAIAHTSRGWVAEEALAVAVYAALSGKTLLEAVAIAVNHDGDSDSTGAICGNIVGASRVSEALSLTGMPFDVAESMTLLSSEIVCSR